MPDRGLSVWGVDNPNTPPQDTQDFYKFDLTAGQSATIVAKSLNGKAVQITLVDGERQRLATGVGGSTNVTQDDRELRRAGRPAPTMWRSPATPACSTA